MGFSCRLAFSFSEVASEVAAGVGLGQSGKLLHVCQRPQTFEVLQLHRNGTTFSQEGQELVTPRTVSCAHLRRPARLSQKRGCVKPPADLCLTLCCDGAGHSVDTEAAGASLLSTLCPVSK